MPRHDFSRREFLIQSGVAALSAGIVFRATPMRAADPGGIEVDQEKLSKVTAFLEQERESGSYPGAAIVASKNGKVVFQHYTGTYHDGLGEERPYNANVRVVFFSYTKGISATVVMMAHQEGLINVDTPVAEYLPEFGVNGKEAITIRHILTHSAGIPSAPTPFMPLRDDKEWKLAIEAVCQAKLEWEPGSRTAYHGVGMMIPAEVVRRMSGQKTWNQICSEKLFEPLAAESLTFDVPGDASLVNTAPSDSDRQDAAQKLVAGHPAGGCHGTLEDGLKILELHLNQGKWNGLELLKEKAFSPMHTVQFAKEIEAAIKKGEAPRHDPWALGWLMRGNGAAAGASAWFGFKDQQEARIFGHAGIDTIIGVANPATGVAMMFNMTRSPKTAEEAVRLRNLATNLVFEAVA